MTYRPSEPGNYVINIKYADEHVQGSPFIAKIGGEPSARLLERITRRREAADVTHVGSQCELSLRVPGGLKGAQRELREKNAENNCCHSPSRRNQPLRHVGQCDQHVRHHGSL